MLIWLVLSACFMAVAVCATGWRKTARRLHESLRQQTDLARSSQVIEEERRMLEWIATGASLSDVLNSLTVGIERIAPGVRCTIMLLDEADRTRLRIVSGPSLSEDYLRAVDGLVIGPDVGACGSAAFRGETVIIEDVATDHRFAEARDFVLSHGIRACWSQPVCDSRNQVLGTFAMYHREIARPRPEELRFARAAAQLAGNAIERIRAQQALNETTQRLSMAERVARFGVWQADFPGESMDISEGMAVLLELSAVKQRIANERFSSMVHSDDRISLCASIDPANACAGTFQSEFRLVLPSGSVRWMRSKWSFEFSATGVKGAIGATVDVTEEMKILNEYREARAAAEASALAARRAESLEQDRKGILELVAKDKPLDQIVLTIAHRVAGHLPGSTLCGIRIESAEAARVAVYPHFPESLANALDTLDIDSIRQSITSIPLAELSSSPDWTRYILENSDLAFRYYRAVPIHRASQLSGLLICVSKDRRQEAASEDIVLQSWSQFARLAVERRGLYDQLSHRARYDALTSLLNRAALYEHLDSHIAMGVAARAGVPRPFAVVYLDLDGFKDVNDTYGHCVGDRVLQHVSEHILKSIRQTDIAARMGGDEFVIVLHGVSEKAEANRIASLMAAAIGQHALIADREMRVGASYGVSVFPPDGVTTEALLKSADEAMYKLKGKRRRHRTKQSATVTGPRVPERAILSR
jgi:diguanylate cyclase (GGDEF)-like protein